MTIFKSFDVLLPSEVKPTWPVIACDQFTSEPEYWEAVKKFVGEENSTLSLVFPEAYLGKGSNEKRIRSINSSMTSYLNDNVFATYPQAFVYVERTLVNGKIRRGLVGVIDLETYDFQVGSVAQVRATEKTVPERIPPRVAIRKEAGIELSHVLLLADDRKDLILGKAQSLKDSCKKLYDFDLMQKGGHITGWLLDGKNRDAVCEMIVQYEACKMTEENGGLAPMVYAVGDGNHSLATAKTIYENLKADNPLKDLSQHPARHVMVELENIYDDSQVFEPIHRLLTDVHCEDLFMAMKEITSTDGERIEWYAGDKKGHLCIKTEPGVIALQVVQSFLDEYLKNRHCAIDYIHGEDSLRKLSEKSDSVGLVMPAIAKDGFFEAIVKGGVFPRKTFSMGHSVEKRYYMEARRIREN